MTMLDIAVVAVALLLGTWGAFFAVAGARWAIGLLTEAGGLLGLFDEACFALLRWWVKLGHARAYHPRHT
jgi:hypothetical protein